MTIAIWLTQLPVDTSPSASGTPAGSDGGALVAYVSLVVAILTPLAAAITALTKWRNRRQRDADVNHVEGQTEAVVGGITMQGWQESRQEVKDARTEAKDARDRAEKADIRADKADKRADGAEHRLRKAEGRIDELERTFREWQRRIQACPTPNPPGCPLVDALSALKSPVSD